ncbi:hypothetical protein M514_23413, partial [Trichuris suis]
CRTRRDAPWARLPPSGLLTSVVSIRVPGPSSKNGSTSSSPPKALLTISSKNVFFTAQGIA